MWESSLNSKVNATQAVRNFHTALVNQIERARAMGGQPTITALCELSGKNVTFLSRLVENMTEEELLVLKDQLFSVGIQSRALESRLEDFKTAPKLKTEEPGVMLIKTITSEHKCLRAIQAIFTVLKDLDSSERHRVMATIEKFYTPTAEVSLCQSASGNAS